MSCNVILTGSQNVGQPENVTESATEVAIAIEEASGPDGFVLLTRTMGGKVGLRVSHIDWFVDVADKP